MQLTYRGVSYQSNSTHQEGIENSAIGKYRGVLVKLINHVRECKSPKNLQLKYRGNKYFTPAIYNA